MNVINHCLHRNWLQYVPSTLSKISFQTSLLPPNYKDLNFKRYENRSSVHTCTKLLAGHSKWANIKHTKGIKDNQKSLVFSKYARLIRLFCKENGGTNPKLNAKLARVIEQARSHNMPMTTIEAALKNVEKSEDNAKELTIVYAAPGGIFVLIDVLTDNIKRTNCQLAPIAKKINLKEQRGSIEGVFEEKGIVMTKGDLSKAEDHALEVGAEDVTEEEGVLTFVCDPRDFNKVNKGIQELKYEIDHAGVEQIPNIHATIKETDVEKFKLMFSRFEDHEDVIKLHYNFEL